MRKNLFIGVVLIMTGLFYGCVKDLHNSGISETTVLKGRVLEESEREPIVNVRVTVTNGTTDYTSTKTNNEGRFELTVNYNNMDKGNYLFLDAGSSGITKRIDLKGMGQESYDYGDVFLYNKNDGARPTISTIAVDSISSSSAVCGGIITSDGGREVKKCGLCWGLSKDPDTTNFISLVEPVTWEFSRCMHGLSPNTTYHVRAFAINAIGPSYGEDREFTTASGGGSATKPTVSTKHISSISSNSAECGGDVTSDGGSMVTERGLCWAKASVTHFPTISNYFVKDDGGGTGTFFCTMTNLSANTDYYVRAYAINAVGISYGDTVPFKTLSGGGYSAPTVITGNSIVTSSTSATCYGDVTSDGGAGISYRGICWSTSPNPTIPHAPWGQIPEPNGTDYIYEGGQETGTFHCDLTNLLPDTKYYYRAFAGNTVDETLAEEVKWFKTLAGNTYPPEVLTWSVDYNPNNNTATCQGKITSEGGASVEGCGICWGTTQNVTIENNPNVVNATVWGTNMFTCTISGFSFGTTYYVRAFATNRYGTGYGNPEPLVIPGGGGIGQTYSYTFESTAENWHQIDADGDGYTWMRWKSAGGNAGHNSEYLVTSESYNKDVGALTPDNYLYSPMRYTIKQGAKISFYVCAQDADWPAEHYGVAVATVEGSPSANDFITIWHETLSPKVKTEGKVRGMTEQGVWYMKTIDLSAYAGQTIWVAVRHFGCTDQFRLNVDDITITTGN